MKRRDLLLTLFAAPFAARRAIAHLAPDGQVHLPGEHLYKARWI